MEKNIKKAVIAMSGGVDSSVAAFLMKDAGYECIGANMRLHGGDEPLGKSCCSLEDVEDARSVAIKLGMPFYVFNFTDKFEEEVISRFISAYEEGQTPNPCIHCNRYLKFEKLYQRMEELGMDYVVTGHYARVVEENGRFLLKKAKDEHKDQSYVLYNLTKKQLEHVLFPLGEYHKEQVRDIAESKGFINAKKHDSQDICFVPDGDYASFIEEHTGKTYPEGDFVDTKGNVLGKHKGIIRYTIGQRKGLGISADRPLYVCNIDPKENKVTLGDNEDLFATELWADDINLISLDSIPEPIRIKAKIRYNQKEQLATALQVGGQIKVTFDTPQRAITKGQAVVLYDGDVVVGGGKII